MVCTSCGSEMVAGAPCQRCGAGANVGEEARSFRAAAGDYAGPALSTSTLETPRTVFCRNCGSALERGQPCPNCAASAARQAYAAMPVAVSGPTADVGLRALAYLLDVIPMIIVGILIGWIPILGAMIFGFILLGYWLLRDFAGHSLGKMLLGLVVVKKDGSPSETTQHVLRNSTIAIGPALLMIPLIGYVLGPVVSFLCIITEVVMLLVKKERIGDIIAGTTVVKKTAVALR